MNNRAFIVLMSSDVSVISVEDIPVKCELQEAPLVFLCQQGDGFMSLVRGGVEGNRGGTVFLLILSKAKFIGYHLQGGGVWVVARPKKGF